jgi:hypothetical protein
MSADPAGSAIAATSRPFTPRAWGGVEHPLSWAEEAAEQRAPGAGGGVRTIDAAAAEGHCLPGLLALIGGRRLTLGTGSRDRQQLVSHPGGSLLLGGQQDAPARACGTERQ